MNQRENALGKLVLTRAQVFVSGSSNKAIFQIATAQHVAIAWNESYFTYKLRIKNLAGTADLTRADAMAGTYAQVAGLSSSGALANSSTCRLIYLRNSNCPFSLIQVKEMGSGQVIDEVQNPGLYAQLALSGQDMLFNDKEHGEYLNFAAGVNKFRDWTWYFPKIATTGTDMVPSRLIPILNGDVAPTTTTANFNSVIEQQMFLFPTVSGGNDGGELYVMPFSDYLENNQMCFGQYNKHSLEFSMNTYAGAMVDVNMFLTAASAGTWTASSNGASNSTKFEVYDFKLRLMKYYLTAECVARFNELANGIGIEIPFRKLWTYNSTFFNTQNNITITINDPRITDLQKIALVLRDVNDVAQDATRDKVMFRTMSSNYLTTGVAGISTTAANNIAVGTGYNGLWRVSARYAQEPVLYEEYLYLGARNFDVARKLASDVFETENGENNLGIYQYSGIDPDNFFFHNAQTQFFIGMDLRTIKGAEGAGFSISKSPLDITLELKTAHAITDSSYQCDVMMLCGSAFNCRIGGGTLMG